MELMELVVLVAELSLVAVAIAVALYIAFGRRP